MTDPSARRGRLGLLHTSSANRDRFGALLKELAPAGTAGIHSVHEDLLRASLDGVDEAEQMATISVALAAMHAMGRLFPRGDRAPAIQPVRPDDIIDRLGADRAFDGWRIIRTGRVSHGFYTSQAMELSRT